MAKSIRASVRWRWRSRKSSTNVESGAHIFRMASPFDVCTEQKGALDQSLGQKPNIFHANLQIREVVRIFYRRFVIATCRADARCGMRLKQTIVNHTQQRSSSVTNASLPILAVRTTRKVLEICWSVPGISFQNTFSSASCKD